MAKRASDPVLAETATVSIAHLDADSLSEIEKRLDEWSLHCRSKTCSAFYPRHWTLRLRSPKCWISDILKFGDDTSGFDHFLQTFPAPDIAINTLAQEVGRHARSRGQLVWCMQCVEKHSRKWLDWLNVSAFLGAVAEQGNVKLLATGYKRYASFTDDHTFDLVVRHAARKNLPKMLKWAFSNGAPMGGSCNFALINAYSYGAADAIEFLETKMPKPPIVAFQARLTAACQWGNPALVARALGSQPFDEVVTAGLIREIISHGSIDLWPHIEPHLHLFKDDEETLLTRAFSSGNVHMMDNCVRVARSWLNDGEDAGQWMTTAIHRYSLKISFYRPWDFSQRSNRTPL